MKYELHYTRSFCSFGVTPHHWINDHHYPRRKDTPATPPRKPQNSTYIPVFIVQVGKYANRITVLHFSLCYSLLIINVEALTTPR
jgi:hypothetical protein